ncbi:MAG: YbaN family protein [Fimbriimonadaceae bacterium]|nr:YbaN family protein [Fimbriimonadaceae bacterium]
MVRHFWNALGLALTGLGILGFVIPGLPGTIFLILALACFKKGSPRLEAWMLNHPWFGSILRDWDEHRWMPLWVKWVSCLFMGLFGIGAVLRGGPWWSWGTITLLCVVGIVYVLTIRTKPAAGKAKGAAPAAESSRIG